MNALKHEYSAPTRSTRARRGRGFKTALAGGVCVLCLLVTLPAMGAGVGRDIIGPHEYDLPTHFKPFNVFVQYINYGLDGEKWNKSGERVETRPTNTLVGLTKFLHAWVPSWAPNIGLGFEVVVPTIDIRQEPHNGRPGTSVSGIGDPLVGPAVWFIPYKSDHLEVTLGMDFLVQVPVGLEDVGGGDLWHLNSAFLYNVNYYKWNLTGDIGYITPLSDSAETGNRPGTVYYTDNLVSYAVSEHLEPFVGFTYEYVAAGDTAPSGYETVVSGGLYIPFGTNTFTFRYSRGVSGENHKATNEIGFRWIYVF